MINWIDIILTTIFSIAGAFSFLKENVGKYVVIMTVSGFCMATSVGFYEYLGAVWSDISFCHGISLIILFIVSMVIILTLGRRVFKIGHSGWVINESTSNIERIMSSFMLISSAAMLTAIAMALMVEIAAWMLAADELSRSSEIFVNGVIGSAIAREMDHLAGYPAIIIGLGVTITGILVSNGILSKRLSNRERDSGG